MPFKSAAARKEYDRQRYLRRKAHGEFVQPSTPRGSNPKISAQNVKSTSYNPPILRSSPVNKSYTPNRPAEPPALAPEKKTNFQVLLEVLGPLAGIPSPMPAPAPARHDPPARPQIISQPAAPRVRPAQQGQHKSGFAPAEGFHIQGE